MKVFQSKNNFNCNFKIKRRVLFKRPGSCLSGFKKRLFNHILVCDGSLMPAWNRRKHGVTYGLTFNHPLQILSKTFGNLGTNHLKWSIGTSLKAVYDPVSTNNVGVTNLKAKTACSRLTDAIETQTYILLYRNLYAPSLPNAKQVLNHCPKSQPNFMYAWNYAYDEPYCNVARAEHFIWVRPGELLRQYEKRSHNKNP